MTSGKFILSDVARKDMCVKFMIVIIMLSILAIAVFVGIYAFRTSRDDISGCKSPEMDPNGLSNWTVGAEMIVFGCFPGHQIEGSDDVLISRCINDEWVPQPPACAALPLKINCDVDQNGLKGSISMWQTSNTTPTFIHGYLNTSSVDKSKIVLSESIYLSRQNCTTDPDFNGTVLQDDNNGFEFFDTIMDEGDLEIYFNSTELLAYKKAVVRVTMVFIDIPTNLTATLISVAQGSNILVMKAPLPKPPVGWSFSGGDTESLVEGGVQSFSVPEAETSSNGENSSNMAIISSKQDEEHENSHKPLAEPKLPTPLPQMEQDIEADEAETE